MSVWLVLFSCIFIIFTTLSIGVSERARRLALMRALGLGRVQIALLIAGEGIFLCIPALLGGLAAGFFLVYLLEEGSASVPVLAWSTVLTAAVCAVGGALLASIIPAWRASRQSPLEAAVPSSGFIGKVSRVPVWSVVAGLACVCLQPAALLLPGLEVETRKWIFFWLGYPGLVAGAPDKDIADRVYIEPLTVEVVEQLILKEKPDSVLPTLGGQAGLNLAMELDEKGFLKEHNIRLIGTTAQTIKKAEDRQEFKDTMEKIGEPIAGCPAAGSALCRGFSSSSSCPTVVIA